MMNGMRENDLFAKSSTCKSEMEDRERERERERDAMYSRGTMIVHLHDWRLKLLLIEFVSLPTRNQIYFNNPMDQEVSNR